MDEFEATSSDEDEEVITDTSDQDMVGELIYTGAYVPRERDNLDNEADVIEALEDHVLVRSFGFPIDMLITPWGNPMRAEYLAVVAAACKAADELATLTSDREVVKLIGWKGETPSKLSGFGVEILFHSAGVLQGVVEAVRESRKAAKPGRLVLPARQAATSTTRPAPRRMPSPNELKKPVGSDPFGRVLTAHGLAFRCVCGCRQLILESVAKVPPIGKMRERQNGSRVGSKDLWRHTFGERCIARFGRGLSLKETLRTMNNEECKREVASRTLRPDFRNVVGNGSATGSSGNGAPAWKLAKMAERTEKDRQIRSAMQSAGKKH